VMVVLDVRSSAEASSGFLNAAMSQTRAALEAHEPLHAVVSELELQLAARPGVEAGLVILRFSQAEGRVEMLNAGMPAVANALPGGGLNVHPALSNPVGRRVGEVHPYELVPLIWGGVWLSVSDGMTNGSLETDSVRELCAKLDLRARGMALASTSGDELYDTLLDLLPAARFVRDDVTCVVVGADPDARFQSGIHSH